MVHALKSAFREGKRTMDQEDPVSTDDLGQYRISLPPGRYFLKAKPKNPQDDRTPLDRSPKGAPPPEAVIPTWFPNAVDHSGARPLDITPGARLSAIDISLIRSRLVRLTVHVDAPAGMEPTVNLDNGRAGWSPTIQLRGDKNPEGDFEIRNVPPGSYHVSASAQPPGNNVDRGIIDFNSGLNALHTRVPVDVGNGSAEKIRVSLVPRGEISGRIVLEGEKSPASIQGSLWFSSEGFGRWFYLRNDLKVSLVLPPGLYTVTLQDPAVFYIKSVRNEGRELIKDGLRIAGSGKLPLEIVLANDTGAVAAAVLDSEDKPVAGATVVLIPETALRARMDRYKTCATDQYGHCTLEHVPPGDYKVFAWEDVEPDIWFDPDFLKDVEARGEPVIVKPAATEPVRLHVLKPKP